jgi:two-component system, cell cycle sensor histidine kinase and response regulator CckA
MSAHERLPEVGLAEAAGQRLAILRALPDLIFVLDRHDVFIDAYAGDASPLVVTPAEFLGRHVRDILPHLADDAVRLCALAREGGGVQTLEYEIDLGGRPCCFEARVSAFDEGRIAIVSRDVTARRQAESDLRRAQAETQRISTFRETILRTAADGIVVYRQFPSDPYLEITLWNDSMTAMTGYTLPEITAIGWHRALYPDPELRERAIARLLDIDRDWHQEEWPLTHKSGGLRTVSISTSTIERDESGSTVVAFVHDLTEQHKIREEQRRLQVRMESAQRLESLGLLAGGVAHDFNNLLTSMIGYADLLMRTVPQESETYRMAGEIEMAAECAIGLTRQMLAYSGGGQSAIGTVAVDDLVRDMAQLLGTAAQKGARLVLELSPAMTLGDESQIRQVVMNLITNAAEAISHDGEIRISTGVRYVARDGLRSRFLHEELPAGDYVWLEVRDTGCGMSAGTLTHIFDPFFSTKLVGRGLGLAAVLGIVRGHGGTIRVTSVEGGGSRFEVLLPYHAGPVDERPIESPSDTNSLAGGMILVVEDDPSVRIFIQRALRRAGFEVATAVDGRDGYERFTQLRDQLSAVLIDYMMPAMKGNELAAEIRKAHAGLPVMLMSGFSEIDVRNQMLDAPMTTFIQKPFRAGDLTRKLQAVLAASRLPEPVEPGADPGR